MCLQYDKITIYINIECVCIQLNNKFYWLDRSDVKSIDKERKTITISTETAKREIFK